jgi:hypothetical protein
VAAAPFRRAPTPSLSSTLGRAPFERPGGPSFEMLAADVVIYEKTGVLHVIGPLAGNDNSAAAG